MNTIYSYDLEELESVLGSYEGQSKICLACNRKFIPYGKRPTRLKFCNRIHYCICPVCGKEFNIDLSVGIDSIKKTCSRKCSNKLKQMNMKATMQEKYGVDNAGQISDHKEKVAKTCLEKYGVPSYSQSEEFKQRAREAWDNKTEEELQERYRKSVQTNQERYGVDNGAQSEHAKQKQIETNRQRYGVDWYRQTDECEQKIRSTNKDKYGDEVYFRTEDYKQKAKSTSLINFGVSHPMKSEKVKQCIRDTNREKYGVDCIFQTEKSKQQLLKSNREKYGVDYTFERQDIQNEIKQVIQERYGVDYALQSSQIQDKIRETFVSKYGTAIPSQTDEVRNKIIETSRSSERKDKFETTCMKRYGVRNPIQVKAFFDKQVKSSFNHYSHDNIRFDSSYELDVYEFLQRNDISCEMQVPLNYEYQGRQHTTYIDFCIDGIFFEVKGAHLMTGIFDYAPSAIPIQVKLDLYRKYHVILITDDICKSMFGKPNSEESNGLKYLSKCPEPLIGVDINLFRKPKFPFRNDRPKSFYSVKVNGQRSAFEAFQDESLRWKMIMNRIMYSGGFIDNQQILNAMNICRICKQPSWFSKSFAKSILERYSTSNVVIDPFAGWGARHDAAIELGKFYIGCDLNKEVVSWHKSKQRNIEYCDANEFKYSGDCTVFICPPYQDIEVYFDSQDSELTQCQWLQIVMNNVPNASEYIMVCKIVDEGWDQYIVDIKKNRSHFGENNEYILVIPNKRK